MKKNIFNISLIVLSLFLMAGTIISGTKKLFVDQNTLIDQSNCVLTKSWHFILMDISDKPIELTPQNVVLTFNNIDLIDAPREKIVGNTVHYRYTPTYEIEDSIKNAWVDIPEEWADMKLLLSCDKVTAITISNFSAINKPIAAIFIILPCLFMIFFIPYLFYKTQLKK